MTTQQFNVLEGLLQEKGYKFYKGHLTSEDFYYYKTFGKGDNPYEEGRSNYQILFRVWDWTQYERYLKDHDYGVDVTIMVSRTTDERVELELSHDGQPISYFENKAESFYEWVTKNFEIEKDEKRNG